MRGELTFIIGGARSGKSALAEQLARQGERVLYVATAEGRDEEMRRRIAAHRAARPKHWDTLEEPLELVAALRSVHNRYDTVLIDCLTLWISNLLLDRRPEDTEDHGGRGEGETSILTATSELLALVASSDADWIVVSNEVGLGVVPASPLGRAYRDVLGRVNQLVAAHARIVYLMVAGISLQVKPAPFGRVRGNAAAHDGEAAVPVSREGEAGRPADGRGEEERG